MSKKMVSLAGRKRTKELQQQLFQNDECVATQKKHELLQLQEEVNVSEQVAEACYVTHVVSKLYEKYQIWSEPLNSNRFRYSPNRCHQMLLNEIRVLLNDVGRELIAEGLSLEECKKQCQNFLDEVTEGLRQKGIVVGHIHLGAS